jgi:hypothetical protein
MLGSSISSKNYQAGDNMNYIKKYYKITVILLVVFMIIILLFERTTIKISGYNVYNTIKELSSDKYKGRRFGTKENMDAVKYVEEQFKSIGLNQLVRTVHT